MHGFHSFRCISLQRMRRNDPSSPGGCLFKNSSVDDIFNMSPPRLSRPSSRKSKTPTPSLKKTKSRKSWPDSRPDSPATPKPTTCTKSADSTPSHPVLSKSESRKSPTPIMFSNSSGMLKPPAIEKQLECTLEELCFGCEKKMKVTRAVVKDTGLVTLTLT